MRILLLPHRPRRNLVILRAGDQSLHPQWIADADRNFDLMVSYYGQLPDRHRDTCDLYETRRGPKWPCLGELLDEHPHLVDQYDAIWLPDDDLAVDTATLVRMFDLFHAHRLQLAQPALTRDSYFTFDTLLQQPGYVLRHMGFVEVMAPLFSREALRRCRESFHFSRIGWGLDFVWPGLIDNPDRRAIAVLDATPVHHTRPVRGGDLYKNHPDADPKEDERRVLARYGRQAARYTAKYEFFGGLCERPPSLLARAWLALRALNAQRRWRRHRWQAVR
ncbi:DUF707 domain-containing protein [Roseateles amylovorans]|uniref:DUF707 domain-containing protein n=1 Tax=Roseateles amylovorans TaxID=2978473 RepID=A0ABY6AYN6_9BURK|nr:DUF707 domain-containing protein [Roseateles amylovorans]UXH78023.1 DUF707 domain-containing protein [Roseateles amylovorans]